MTEDRSAQATDAPRDGAAMVGAYFAYEIDEARAEVQKAQAKLAEAERRAQAFAESGEVEPNPRLFQTTGQVIAVWASAHCYGQIRDASPAEIDRAHAEYGALVEWLVDHGFELTEAHRAQAAERRAERNGGAA